MKGLSAEGLFGPASSKKAHWELKEALGRGGDVNWGSQTVQLLVLVVKVISDLGLQVLPAMPQLSLQ